MNATTDYDVVIIGGGLAGISLALALDRITPALRVALIETHDYQRNGVPSFDSRTVALSYSSRQIFQGLNVWPALLQAGVAPIRTIHISDRGHPGVTRLSATEQNVDALGYVVENRLLGNCLYEAMQGLKSFTLLAPAKVVDVGFAAPYATLHIEQQEKSYSLTSRLVVAADGTQSFVRNSLGIASWYLDYHQHAVIANVAVDRPHQDVAYERFTEQSPMALLPLPAFADTPNRFGLVWTVPERETENVLKLSDADFLQALQRRFGDRAGRFIRAGKRTSYPLGMMQTREHVRHRLAFIGNAAHTLHPVAGQGFNLGLRDVAALAQIIRDAQQAQRDIGAVSELQQYARWRQRDQWQTALFTDSLVRVFSTAFPPLVLARNAALLALELFSPLRKRVTQHAMGYIGRASLLARGLGL